MAWLRNRLEYWSVRCLLGLLRIVPVSCAYALARGVADCYYALGFGRRRLTLQNLKRAFPEKSADERTRIARHCYRSAATTAVEGMLILNGRFGREDIYAMVDGAQVERLLRLEQETDKGLLVIAAHFGNWELLSHYLGLCTRRGTNVVGRKTTNPLLEKHVIQPLRERFGSKLIYKKKALVRSIRALKRGEHVGMLIDQKSNRKNGVEVEFFGVTLLAAATPALLQIRYGVPVIPAFMVRTGRGRYCLQVEAPVPWQDSGAPEEEQMQQLTQIHQNTIESMIRTHPEQWFWMHDRWRTRQ